MSSIAINQVLEWLIEGKKEIYRRVLYVNRPQNVAVVIDLNSDIAWPFSLELDELEALMKDEIVHEMKYFNARQLIPEEKLSPVNKRKRDKAWEMISELVRDEPEIYFPEFRGSAVKDMTKKHNCSHNTINRYLRRFWQNGKTPNALLPWYDHCGAPGKERKAGEKKRGRPPKIVRSNEEKKGINVTPEIRRKFRIGIQEFYDKKVKRPLYSSYVKTMAKYFKIGIEEKDGILTPIVPPTHKIPTFGQFRYWLRKEHDLRKLLLGREGSRAVNLRMRERTGRSSLEAFGPGSRFQIDATIGDIYLVSQFNRNYLIGRPVIYAVIDVFSRMAAGLYVGLEGTSWIGAMMALANTASNKVEFCADYGIHINERQWPCSYLPDVLTADRGELRGDKPKNLITTLHVNIETLPPYRADWKGIVERYFGRCNESYIDWLPGAVVKRERGDRDYRLDAKLTLREFTRLAIRAALIYNNHHRLKWYDRSEFMIQDEVEPYPIKLWEWGITKRTGRLRHFEPDIVRLNLMPRGTARVTEEGIKFRMPDVQTSHAAFYTCKLAVDEQWFFKARNRDSWEVEVSYDPRLADYIYLPQNGGRGFEKCNLLGKNQQYIGKRWEEIVDLREREILRNKETETEELQGRVDMEAELDDTNQNAKKKTNALNQGQVSKKQWLKNIKPNRKMERDETRKSEAFNLGDSNDAPKSAGKIVGKGRFPLTDEEEDSAPPPSYMDILSNLGEDDEQ